MRLMVRNRGVNVWKLGRRNFIFVGFAVYPVPGHNPIFVAQVGHKPGSNTLLVQAGRHQWVWERGAPWMK